MNKFILVASAVFSLTFVTSARAEAKASAKAANRKVAVAESGNYVCSALSQAIQSNGARKLTGLESMDETCDKSKPFSISTTPDSLIWFCCVAK